MNIYKINQLGAYLLVDQGKDIKLNILKEEAGFNDARKCLDKSTMRRYSVEVDMI